MNAHDTLSRIVQHEAGKLLKRSETSDALLQGEDLASLEVLARCAKALRGAAEPVPSASDSMTAEEALALVTE